MDHGHLHAAVNRIYYACFYSVSALLLTEGDSSAKHARVRALFDTKWIKAGRLPAHSGRFYHRIFDRRQKGDYADLTAFANEEVAAWLEEARDFVEVIAERIRSADQA